MPCCDAGLEPGPTDCDEAHICCPDGSWGCSILSKPGVYGCNGVEVENPAPGTICPRSLAETPCCLLELMKTCDRVACCDDGTWVCPDGTGKYNCNGKIGPKPSGKACTPSRKNCCDRKNRRNDCPTGNDNQECCSDGSWACLNSLALPFSFKCGNVDVKLPLGDPCNDNCCIPETEPQCPGGGKAVCCATGDWVCPNDPVIKECGTANICQGRCCPRKTRPSCNGPLCCSDGSWTCHNGGYTCGGKKLIYPKRPQGKPCSSICCPKESRPDCGARCCYDGTWVCGNEKCPTKGPTGMPFGGEICNQCCPPNGADLLCSEQQCCSNGVWGCKNNNLYECGFPVGDVKEPKGDICPDGPLSYDCCPPESGSRPNCGLAKAVCCYDGTWVCQEKDCSRQYTTAAPSNGAPMPGPSNDAPTPSPPIDAPTPGPSISAPTPGPSNDAPTPGPPIDVPTPGPSNGAPTPGPSNDAPTPGPSNDSASLSPYSDSPSQLLFNSATRKLQVVEDRMVCTRIDDDSWIYSEPVWWNDIVSNSSKGENLQKCRKRQFAPVNGTSCGKGKLKKTCYFGTQPCEDGKTIYYRPVTKCVCGRHQGSASGTTWRCTPVVCTTSQM